jgi:hypothetical protein
MKPRVHRPMKPQGNLTAGRMVEFATCYAATMDVEAAREAVEQYWGARRFLDSTVKRMSSLTFSRTDCACYSANEPTVCRSYYPGV